MKKNKAFTLIELLAVIIILSIVALIATPIILDVVEDARISAGRSEANMILGGINNYCASEDMKYQLDNSYKKICTTSMNAENVKTMVNLGNATIDKITYNGSKLIELVITSNNHKFTLCPSGTFAMDDEKCDGEDVVITTGPFIDILMQQYSEENTTGLVKDATNENLYYYTGTNEEVSNNFLWYGGHQWRVLEFDTEAETLTLITQQPLTAIQSASAVWTTKEAYDSSYINTWLNDYFYNSLDSDIQNNILNSTFNIGIYTDIDEITTTQKVGLLDEFQYVRAGSADSFLDIKDYFFLGNRENSTYIRCVYFDGIQDGRGSNPYASRDVRAVIKISNINITKGKGTLEDSFRIENKSISTNDVQVGEYINVPYSGSDNACGNDNMCTFRVVSKDNDSIKVVLNGLLPSESEYGSSITISTSHTIYTALNKFAEGISDAYRFTENKPFYIGDYLGKTSYLDIKDEQLEVNIGLPTVGEMFSGNDIEIKYPLDKEKIFVDINTIENPYVSSLYWTMNRSASPFVNVVSSNFFGIWNHSEKGGVRPVIYLKYNLNFTGGEGTAQLPYTIQ